jgi:hypothetical protein
MINKKNLKSFEEKNRFELERNTKHKASVGGVARKLGAPLSPYPSQCFDPKDKGTKAKGESLVRQWNTLKFGKLSVSHKDRLRVCNHVGGCDSSIVLASFVYPCSIVV